VQFVPGLFPLIFQCEDGQTDRGYIEQVKQNAKEFLNVDKSVIIFPFDDQVSDTLDDTNRIAKPFATKPRAFQSHQCLGSHPVLTLWSQI
jgi:hypothetical protein